MAAIWNGLPAVLRGADLVTCGACDETVAQDAWNDHVLDVHQPRHTSAIKLRLYDEAGRTHDYALRRRGLGTPWKSDPMTRSFTCMAAMLVMPSGFEVPAEFPLQTLDDGATVQFGTLDVIAAGS